MGKIKKDNSLTERQKQVLGLIADGKSASEIAEELGISRTSIMAHSAHIRLKLDIYNTAALVKYALKNNLTTFEK